MPSPVIPSLRVLGPSWIKMRNQVFYTAGSVIIRERLNPFDVRTAHLGTVEQREDSLTYEIRFTPAGKLDALSVLWPYGIAKPGQLIHATAIMTGVNAGTNVITFDSLARFRDGAPVRIGATLNDPPAGLTSGALKYLHKLTSTTGTLHDTEADALANTGAIDLSDAGTGRNTIIEQEYLVIQPFDGSAPLRFLNAAVVQSPAMTLGANSTAIGEVVIEAFRQFGVAASDAASFYDQPTVITDTSFDFNDIKTESFSMAWGAALPWSAMAVRSPIGVSFPLELGPWGDDVGGIATRIINQAGAQVTASPIGLTEADVFAKRSLQGAGAGRGRRITSSDSLNLSSTTNALLYVRLYGAILTDPGELVWDPLIERTGTLGWQAQRVVTAGVPGDLYYVGASAPS